MSAAPGDDVAIGLGDDRVDARDPAHGEPVDAHPVPWERRDAITRRLLALADLVGITGAALVAGAMAGSREQPLDLMLATLPTLPVWVVVFKLYGLYDRDTKRISHTSLDDLPWLFHALVVGTLLMWGYTKVVSVHQLTFAESAIFGTSGVLLTAALRAAVRKAVLRVLGPERVLLAGTAPIVAPLVRKIDQHPEYGLLPVGLLSSDGHSQASDRAQKDGHLAGAAAERGEAALPVVGEASKVERAVREARASRVVICRPAFDGPEVIDIVQACRRLSVKVSILPDAVEALGPSTEVDEVEGVTVLGVNPPVLSRSSRLLKRTFDIAIAGTLLLLLLPLYPLIALAIKLDSPGPVLFRQRRVGEGGRRFELLKLRTMVADAERRRAELVAKSRDPNWLHLEHDPRITRVGRFLRHTSLDEVPQLWNVLKGEMSLVGPRPLPEEEDSRVGGWERRRLDLTPGITGFWQVLGRTRIPFDEMVKLDYVYVTNWSLWMDVKLLLQTLPAVLRRRGTN